MFKRAAKLLAFFLLAAALRATAAPASETPVLQVFKQWLDAFNSSDAARISAFWQKYGRNKADDRVAGDLRLRNMTGGMTIYRVAEDSDTHLVVLMKENRGAYSESTMDLSSVNPPIVAGLMGHPVPPPEGAENPASSDDELAARVQKHVAETSGSDAFSGAILVAHNGKTVLDQAWGMADETKSIRNTTDSQFCIGSMNKMFTAVAILQLVGAGKLALDKSIVTYWPDYPNRDLAARVTIRELLNHTGGTGDIFTPEYEAYRQETRALADYIKLFGTRPVAFEPGTRMEYSNYGFILLGRIIELVTREPYEKYIRGARLSTRGDAPHRLASGERSCRGSCDRLHARIEWTHAQYGHDALVGDVCRRRVLHGARSLPFRRSSAVRQTVKPRASARGDARESDA